MTRTASEAIAWARNESLHGSARWHNMCLAFVHTTLDIGARYPSAANAWENANYKHRVNSGEQCPRGVPVFWTGGSSGYGHIVLSVGGGLCYSTDFRRYGRCDLVRIDDITRSWGQNFQGWTEDLNGVRCYQDAPTEAEKFAGGDVYLSKLKLHVQDSDSVRRLQARLLSHKDIPAVHVRITGTYADGTRSAVQYYQRNVTNAKGGPRDGTRLSFEQANHLFGEHYNLIKG